MKKLEIIIPDRELQTVSGILRDKSIGGMNHYRIEGKGKTKAEPISAGRGTMQYTPEFIPRTKVETVVKDDMVENIIIFFFSPLYKVVGTDLGNNCIHVGI